VYSVIVVRAAAQLSMVKKWDCWMGMTAKASSAAAISPAQRP
jgi:hypothetical protein